MQNISPTAKLYSIYYTLMFDGRGCRTVWGMNSLRSLGGRDYGFESRLWHGCLMYVRVFLCVVLCLGRALATSWSPIQGVLPPVKRSRNWVISPILSSRVRGQEGNIYIHTHTLIFSHLFPDWRQDIQRCGNLDAHSMKIWHSKMW
jgi:hypothetical protein